MRRCGWTRLGGACSSLRVSDQLSGQYCAEVSSAMRFRTRWRIWSQIYRTWSRLIRPGRPNPVLVAFVMEIGARVATAHCDHHVEGFTALRISGCSSHCRCPLGHGLDGDGDNHYPLPALLSAYRTDCITKPQRSMPNRFRWSVAKIVCRITNLEESLSRARPLCRPPLAHWLRSPSGADCRCRRGRGRGVWGGGGAKRRDQASGLSSGMQDQRSQAYRPRRDRDHAKTARTGTSRGNRRRG